MVVAREHEIDRGRPDQLVVLAPLYWMVVVAFSPRAELLSPDLRLWPRTFTLDNVHRMLDAFPVWTWFGNSVAIVVVTTLLTVTVDLLAGFALAVAVRTLGPAAWPVLRRAQEGFQRLEPRVR